MNETFVAMLLGGAVATALISGFGAFAMWVQEVPRKGARQAVLSFAEAHNLAVMSIIEDRARNCEKRVLGMHCAPVQVAGESYVLVVKIERYQ